MEEGYKCPTCNLVSMRNKNCIKCGKVCELYMVPEAAVRLVQKVDQLNEQILEANKLQKQILDIRKKHNLSSKN